MTKMFDKTNWGFEKTLVDGNQYSCRVLTILEGNSTPYIYHKRRDKTICILNGKAMLVIEGKSRMLNEGESYHILPKMMHRVAALGEDVTLIEVGNKLEDDIVKVEE